MCKANSNSIPFSFQSEYKSLCELCKNYAVELLELCRSNEEVLAALHGGSNTRDLSRIKLAIRYEQKKVKSKRNVTGTEINIY